MVTFTKDLGPREKAQLISVPTMTAHKEGVWVIVGTEISFDEGGNVKFAGLRRAREVSAGPRGEGVRAWNGGAWAQTGLPWETVDNLSPLLVSLPSSGTATQRLLFPPLRLPPGSSGRKVETPCVNIAQHVWAGAGGKLHGDGFPVLMARNPGPVQLPGPERVNHVSTMVGAAVLISSRERERKRQGGETGGEMAPFLPIKSQQAAQGRAGWAAGAITRGGH